MRGFLLHQRREGKETKVPSPNILLNFLRAYAAHTRDYFPFTRKVIKGVPKRRRPLWKHLWRGTSPRELREAKFFPPVFLGSKRMLGFAPAASGSRVPSLSAVTIDTVGDQRGSYLTPFVKFFKLPEVKEPGGSLCALCETFFTQESFRGCGPRRPTKVL